MVGRALAVALVIVATADRALPQNNRIDTVTPIAPELAAPGPHAVGVRTIR